MSFVGFRYISSSGAGADEARCVYCYSSTSACLNTAPKKRVTSYLWPSLSPLVKAKPGQILQQQSPNEGSLPQIRNTRPRHGVMSLCESSILHCSKSLGAREKLQFKSFRYHCCTLTCALANCSSLRLASLCDSSKLLTSPSCSCQRQDGPVLT